MLTDKERDHVRTVLSMPGYAILREMIAARQCEALTAYMEGSLYATDAAKDQATVSLQAAQRYGNALEVLDLLGNPEQEWFRIKLDQRR